MYFSSLGTKALKKTPSKSRSEKGASFSNSVTLRNKEALQNRLFNEFQQQYYIRKQGSSPRQAPFRRTQPPKDTEEHKLLKDKDHNLLNHRIYKNPQVHGNTKEKQKKP